MSKEFKLYCAIHGHITIEIERPPVFSKSVGCPWCTRKLIQPDKDTQKKWQPNYIAEGAQA